MPARPANIVAVIAALTSAAVFIATIGRSGIDGGIAGSLVIFIVAALAAARREQRLEIVPLAAALAAVIVGTDWALAVLRIGEAGGGWREVMANPGLLGAIATGGIFGLFGFGALWGAQRPGYWAALSAFVPPVALIAVAVALRGTGPDWFWAALALAMSLLYLGAAVMVGRYRADPRYEAALAAYALAIVGTVAHALATLLAEAWLTVALSVELAAVAWIASILRVPALRAAAFILAGAVFARLVLNPAIASYAMGATPFWNWLLYGYGLAIAAFLVAARRFGGALAMALDAGALVLALVMIGLEIRTLVSMDGQFTHADYLFVEQALHSLALLGSAYVLLRWSRLSPNPVLHYGWRIVFSLGLAHAVLFPVLLANPLFGAWPRSATLVGQYALFNLLAVAYGLPALISALVARSAASAHAIARIAAVGSLVLALVWLTLEVRHAYHGSDLRRGATVDGEWYAYSAAWLVFGAVLLAAGIGRRSPELRWASLAVVMLAVAKVFLWDMSALTGIFRALSLICLGLSLVGIAYLYQRFVFPRPAPA